MWMRKEKVCRSLGDFVANIRDLDLNYYQTVFEQIWTTHISSYIISVFMVLLAV